MRKRLRRLLPASRIYYQASEVFQTTVVPQRALNVVPQGATVGMFLRASVPGWPHFVRGQRLRGHLFLWGLITFLLMGLLMLGSVWGSVFLGLAFSVHSSAMADILNQDLPDAGVAEKMGRGAAVSLLLFLFIYWPARLLLQHYAEPYVLQTTMSPFEPGDVVLVRNNTVPNVGDIVLYDLANYFDYIGLHEGRRFDVIAGRTIDRILAGPGDKISGGKGIFMVNGMPARYNPLNPIEYPGHFALVVPKDDFLIFPSGSPNLSRAEVSVDWTHFIFVPRPSIVGQVFLRTQPLNRFRFFR